MTSLKPHMGWIGVALISGSLWYILETVLIVPMIFGSAFVLIAVVEWLGTLD